MKKLNLLLFSFMFIVSMSGAAAHATETVAEKVSTLLSDISSDRSAVTGTDASGVSSARSAVQSALAVYESSKSTANKTAEKDALKALNVAYAAELSGHKPKGEALIPGYAQLLANEASLLTVYSNHKADYEADIAPLKTQIVNDKASKKAVQEAKKADNKDTEKGGFTINAKTP